MSPSFVCFFLYTQPSFFSPVSPLVHVVSTVAHGQVGRNPSTSSRTNVARDYLIWMYATTTQIWHHMHFLRRHLEIIERKRKLTQFFPGCAGLNFFTLRLPFPTPFFYLQAARIVVNYPFRPPDAAAPSAPRVISKLVCLFIVSGLVVLTLFLPAITRPVGAARCPLQA